MNRRVIVAALSALLMSFPMPAQESAGRKDVGIFYFAWLGQHPKEQTGIYDISRLMKEHPGDLYDTGRNPRSPMFKYHFWSEPLYGYYNSADPWVITRHMELFMAAGIDYIVFDTTNGFIYPEVVGTLLDVLLGFQAQGMPVPKVSFYTHGASDRTVDKLYHAFYESGKYDSLWYRPEGRPMIVGVTSDNKGSADMRPPLSPMYIRDEYRTYYDVREAQWPTMPVDKASFPWMSWEYPQTIHNGVVSVSVAQHSTRKILFSDTLCTRGRGYDAPTGRNLHDQVRTGRNFQNQWKTALDHPGEVDNVFMTGWNEWATIKYVFDGEVGFVDTFTEEFSRDIEMMKGGYEDGFYLMMSDKIREFKSKGPDLLAPEYAGGACVYRDPSGDAMIRDFVDMARTGHYADSSARNDIVEVAVSSDEREISFRIKTRLALTPWEQKDTTWMNVLVQVQGKERDGFPYDFIIGRHRLSRHTSSIERVTPSGIVSAGKAVYSVDADELTVTVLRKSLDLPDGRICFSFKVADHIASPFDMMDYYVSGDSAPIGRLNYIYKKEE